MQIVPELQPGTILLAPGMPFLTFELVHFLLPLSVHRQISKAVKEIEEINVSTQVS